MKFTGGCYCGQVRYEAEGDPLMKAQCSCRECRYITGGGSNFFIAMPRDGFKYTKGKASSFTRDDLDNPVTREFCPNCGTHIITDPPGFPAVVVKIGSMDDPTQFEGPDIALYVSEKPDYLHVADHVKAFDKMPG
jgi:hypothetical protein